MIDAYLSGEVNRMSPEAPVPIVDFKKREERLGGAANVALNLISLGAQVTMSTVIGNDAAAKKMMQLFEESTISAHGILQTDTRQTTMKTRVIGNFQQLLRIDQEQKHDLLKIEEDQLIARVEDLLKEGYDALIFEDYNKGILTHRVIQEVIQLTKRYGVITTVDPKLDNFLSYVGVTLFKPNLKELKEGVQQQFDVQDRDQFEGAVKTLRSKIQPKIVFVTMSEHGVYIDSKEERHYIAAHPRMISDVSGAGDTVIGVATLCLAAQQPISTIAQMANLAGGIVCEQRGVVAINAQHLLDEANKFDIECG